MTSNLSSNRRYRTARTKRALKVLPSSQGRGNNAALVTASVNMTVLTLTFDRPVVLRSTPTGILTDVAETEASAAQTSPTVIEITYTGSVAAATEVILPDAIQSIRTGSGGFARSLTFPVT